MGLTKGICFHRQFAHMIMQQNGINDCGDALFYDQRTMSPFFFTFFGRAVLSRRLRLNPSVASAAGAALRPRRAPAAIQNSGYCYRGHLQRKRPPAKADRYDPIPPENAAVRRLLPGNGPAGAPPAAILPAPAQILSALPAASAARCPARGSRLRHRQPPHPTPNPPFPTLAQRSLSPSAPFCAPIFSNAVSAIFPPPARPEHLLRRCFLPFKITEKSPACNRFFCTQLRRRPLRVL